MDNMDDSLLLVDNLLTGVLRVVDHDDDVDSFSHGIVVIFLAVV